MKVGDDAGGRDERVLKRNEELIPKSSDVVGLLSDGNEVSKLLLSGGLAQTLKLASFLIDELKRSSLLHDPPLVHDQDLGAWHDSLTLATETIHGTGLLTRSRWAMMSTVTPSN
jgi:hypothetical protein